MQPPADRAGEPLQVRDDPGLACRDVDRAAPGGETVPLAGEPDERERLVAPQVGEVEDEVVALLLHHSPDRLVDERELDVSQIRADVDDARALAEPVDAQLDERRATQWVR